MGWINIQRYYHAVKNSWLFLFSDSMAICSNYASICLISIVKYQREKLLFLVSQEYHFILPSNLLKISKLAPFWSLLHGLSDYSKVATTLLAQMVEQRRANMWNVPMLMAKQWKNCLNTYHYMWPDMRKGVFHTHPIYQLQQFITLET